MSDLAGRVAVVTGAGGGIGSATAHVLAAAGASVMVADIAADAGTATVDSINAAGGSASFAPFDATDAESVSQLMDHAVSTYGRLDLVHNNAAATHLYDVDRDLEDLEPGAWDEIMTINARGVMLGCRFAIPHLVRSGGGAIVNMSSTRAALGAADLAAYGASKAAVDSLTRYVATQFGSAGVRCNAIQPGYIETAQSRALHGGGDGPSPLMRHIPSARPGRPEDIAHLVRFLASDDGAYINGQSIRVDGGMLSHQPFTTFEQP
ncbi:SDR family NAD(P)-dependent oxidoreductase [Nocardioides currus]|uniref:NAD(P)-dependent oxidoreductase n=1 Tax=Nocardioides currus TaxID=2133958 RepID=A0A2R7Z2G9_9ACTN|nr:glucose 1-dehydrogenase [Nocardioides currus]PUA82800.1 NAD(P)-dependent oxidoreductase [Nocardioides currus]